MDRARVLAPFSGIAEESPPYLPDLTLWYEWHRRRGTLPAEWRDYTLPQIAQALGVPAWLVARPWRVETPGIEIGVSEANGTRVVRSQTPAGTLVSRWILGPDGAWWQTEYLVKTPDDLAAALELVRARTYLLDTVELARLEPLVGSDGLLALEIPRRPYSDLLHDFLGWGEGLLLLGEPVLEEIMATLEAKLQNLVQAVAELPAQVVLSPDNLDGQYISPATFRIYLSDSYRLTAEVLHRHGRYLVVHAGGPVRRLLAPMAAAGVDVVEGVAGPPQGDASLAQAREVAGPELTLWGGIPQDFLLSTYDRTEFEAAVAQAAQEAKGDRRMILGVADRVPVDAELSRLEVIPGLIRRARRSR